MVFWSIFLCFGLLLRQPAANVVEKKPYQDLETYVNRLKQNLSAAEKASIRQQLQTEIGDLQKLGWSNQAIQSIFLKRPSATIRASQIAAVFDKRFKTIKVLGSSDFQKMWEIEGKSKTRSAAKRQLKIAVNTAGMPKEISVSKKESARLISHFSNDIEPNDDFWKLLAEAVQRAFPDRSLARAGDLEQRVHQLRYVISAQQAQWVRHTYRKTGMTDAQALAHYMKDMDETNNFFEKIGVDKSDYYYNYNFGESSRLHNKVAVFSDSLMNKMKYYPDGKDQVNFKIVMNFYSEFILNESGHFVNVLDPEVTTENGVINGASFNYANENNSQHRYLDIYPVRLHDPKFRRTFLQKYQAIFKAPNKVKQSRFSNRQLRWEDSYFNKNGHYAKDGSSSFQRVGKAIRAYKKLVKENKYDKKNEKN
ncbi:hypothetical cytosolic protein [Streptococcus macacae NCTC 11558]|uniref:DUF3114 domain-containing protein n=2 Tax=Streptococcus macacae TaxID=1339 RepID=G5JV05_9STRE|nr:hypothetical protein STRMA_1390 [Streptococcus macacae NCTC 11558]SUN79303.1 hypothetical cytosolic protein [Streptococcus macacae NCTC 11558]